MTDTTKAAFIVKDLPTSAEAPENLDELRKIKNEIARKLRNAKDKQFFDNHPNIAKLAVAQPGAIPQDKEEVKVKVDATPMKVAETPMSVKEPEPARIKLYKPVDIPKPKAVDVPKPNQSKGTPAYAPSPSIQNLVANIGGGAKWF
jgi:hypothetical protein